jgi:hypothetical protein
MKQTACSATSCQTARRTLLTWVRGALASRTRVEPRTGLSRVGRAGLEPATLGLKVRAGWLLRPARGCIALKECGLSAATRCSEMQGSETVRYSNSYSRAAAQCRRGECDWFVKAGALSDGLEPLTPSLPCAPKRLPWVATGCGSGCLNGFRGRPICHRLPPVAPALLHKCSTTCRPI